MRVIALQHSERDRLGLVGQMPVDFDVFHTYDGSPLPSLGDADGLVVMGGPQHVYTDEGFPSRRAELALIAEALEAQIPVLGVCLGAQLLAVAAGGRCYRRDKPERGYLPVALTPEGLQDPLFAGCPPVFIPRHHHEDSYDMPPGAVRLASSDECLEQAFRVGPNAWGVQFHFEMLRADADPSEDELRLQAITSLTPTAKQIISNFSALLHTSNSIAS